MKEERKKKSLLLLSDPVDIKKKERIQALQDVVRLKVYLLNYNFFEE